MIEPTASCDRCLFADPGPKPTPGQFFCRRFPPTMIAAARLNPLTRQTEELLVSNWPTVKAGAWCGEFQLRPLPEIQDSFGAGEAPLIA